MRFFGVPEKAFFGHPGTSIFGQGPKGWYFDILIFWYLGSGGPDPAILRFRSLAKEGKIAKLILWFRALLRMVSFKSEFWVPEKLMFGHPGFSLFGQGPKGWYFDICAILIFWYLGPGGGLTLRFCELDPWPRGWKYQGWYFDFGLFCLWFRLNAIFWSSRESLFWTSRDFHFWPGP